MRSDTQIPGVGDRPLWSWGWQGPDFIWGPRGDTERLEAKGGLVLRLWTSEGYREGLGDPKRWAGPSGTVSATLSEG